MWSLLTQETNQGFSFYIIFMCTQIVRVFIDLTRLAMTVENFLFPRIKERVQNVCSAKNSTTLYRIKEPPLYLLNDTSAEKSGFQRGGGCSTNWVSIDVNLIVRLNQFQQYKCIRADLFFYLPPVTKMQWLRNWLNVTANKLHGRSTIDAHYYFLIYIWSKSTK